jgi:hypothetical protein
METNVKASSLTPLFYGSLVARLVKTHDLDHLPELTRGMRPVSVDIEDCRTMKMIATLPGNQLRFMDTNGRV